MDPTVDDLQVCESLRSLLADRCALMLFNLQIDDPLPSTLLEEWEKRARDIVSGYHVGVEDRAKIIPLDTP